MSTNDLTKLINSLAKDAQNNEKLAIPYLASKLKKLAEVFPYDQTIVTAAKVLTHAFANNKLTMTRAQFRDLYKRLYARNTKFADHFTEELGEIEKAPSPKMYEKHVEPITNIYEGTDQVLANKMASAIDGKVALKLYSQEQAAQALKYVSHNLDLWNVKASKLEVAGGNEVCIMVRASYDTPKGLVNMLVPVEINAGKLLDPSLFVSNGTVKKLNHTNVKEHILSSVQAEQKVVKEERPLETPKAEKYESFAEKFNSPLGLATLKFGADKVNSGRDAVIRTLAALGVDHPQTNILGVDQNTITYGVSLGGKVAFKVPVKFANNRIMTPELMICNGSVMALNKSNVNGLFLKNETDYKVAASTSPLYGLKVGDLIDGVRIAAAEHNYIAAEDALNVLQQMGDDKAYRAALQEYKNGLLVKTAEKKTTCSMIIKSAASQHPTCGHTGLPIHKVYQDEHGNCQPLYRKDMPQKYEVSTFNTHKILG